MRRLIDEHGKLFGLINPVDLAVILILLALGIKILADYRPAPLNLKKHSVTVGILIKNIPLYLAESITSGQDLFAERTGAYIGKIYAVKKEPARLLLVKNGQIIEVQSPRKVDLRLTVRNKGRIILGPARAGVYLGKLNVRVGERIAAHTLYSSIQGEIEFLRVGHVR
ncbi:MAG: DUF4330 family protein [Bacillota bacterium]